MQDQELPEQICFYMALTATGERDLRADLIKPFVFLDRFEFDGKDAPPLQTGWHPHSGIATVTVVLDGTVRYAETTGAAVTRARPHSGHTGPSIPARSYPHPAQ